MFDHRRIKNGMKAIFALNFHVTCLKNILNKTACPKEGEQ
jgi:hypothetical protein